MATKESPSQEVPPHRDQQAQPVPEVPPAAPSSASATFSETLTQEEVELESKIQSYFKSIIFTTQEGKIGPGTSLARISSSSLCQEHRTLRPQPATETPNIRTGKN